MYISVIPLAHSLSKHPYIYFVPPVWTGDLRVGYLVEIPIGKHMVTGIVAKVDVLPDSGIRVEDIRSIISVRASIEIVAPYMISMIEEIAGKYYLLIHKVASMFLPAPLLSRLDKKNYILDTGSRDQDNPKSLTPTEIHHYIDVIFQKEDLDEYMAPDTVFIFPDDILLALFSPGEDRADIRSVPTELSPTRRAAAWIDIFEKKEDIIFGTRRLLYYNLSRYSHIIYIEDAFGAEHYTYPIKIQNLDILKSLERAGNHQISIISSTPSLMTLSTFHKARRITHRR